MRYTHVVRLREFAEPDPERGTGSLSGPRLELQGSWKDAARQYERAYGGVFVRRAREIERHADLDRGRPHLDPSLRRRDQAAAEGLPAAQKNVASEDRLRR